MSFTSTVTGLPVADEMEPARESELPALSARACPSATVPSSIVTTCTDAVAALLSTDVAPSCADSAAASMVGAPSGVMLSPCPDATARERETATTLSKPPAAVGLPLPSSPVQVELAPLQ